MKFVPAFPEPKGKEKAAAAKDDGEVGSDGEDDDADNEDEEEEGTPRSVRAHYNVATGDLGSVCAIM